MNLFTTIANRLIAISERRPPDFIIGSPEDPYLRRWWIIPRNRFFNIYLHHFLRSDDDRALHDLPWWNCSILLRGAYLEIMENHTHAIRQTGSIVIRRATHRHRIHLLNIAERPHANAGNLSWEMTVSQWADWFHNKYEPFPCWTLFITGPKIRDWGFWCPQGFVPWQIFSNPANPGEIGKGCAE